MNSSSTPSKPKGEAPKPRLLVKPVPNGMYKVRLHDDDKAAIQQLQDDITDVDPTIDVLKLKPQFGGTGWLIIEGHVYRSIKEFYEVLEQRSRVKIRR